MKYFRCMAIRITRLVFFFSFQRLINSGFLRTVPKRKTFVKFRHVAEASAKRLLLSGYHFPVDIDTAVL